MNSVLTVANRILGLAEERNRHLTPLQLMKLAYISNGWSLALRDQPLFRDRIEAWKLGPVIPVLYQRTKEYGSGPITDTLPQPAGDKFDPDADELLRSVFDNYAHFSGAALSSLTHRPGTPWSRVWRDGVSHIEIPVSLIREHYKQLAESRTVRAA